MKFYNITSKSVEIIGKCLEQCLCTRQYSYVAKLFAYISPLDRDFCMSPCIDKKQCGGKGLNQALKLFEEIIAVFVKTYHYALGVDLYA